MLRFDLDLGTRAIYIIGWAVMDSISVLFTKPAARATEYWDNKK
jgi:hypothetical protein